MAAGSQFGKRAVAERDGGEVIRGCGGHWLAIGFFFAGCGDDGSATAATDAAPLPCEVTPGEFSCSMELSCSAPVLNSCEIPTTSVEGDPACVITSLLAATPSYVEITSIPDSSAVFCDWYDHIFVIGDGTAVVQRVVTGDVLGGTVQRVTIREPSFFEACAQSDDPALLHDCLSDWFVRDSCVGSVCCPVPDENGTRYCGD